MGELGVIRSYVYWSDRRIRDIASANGIALERRVSWKAKTASILLIGGLEFAQEARTLDRAEVARRIETAIGDLAVEDFRHPAAGDVRQGRRPCRLRPVHGRCREATGRRDAHQHLQHHRRPLSVPLEPCGWTRG